MQKQNISYLILLNSFFVYGDLSSKVELVFAGAYFLSFPVEPKIETLKKEKLADTEKIQ